MSKPHALGPILSRRHPCTDSEPWCTWLFAGIAGAHTMARCMDMAMLGALGFSPISSWAGYMDESRMDPWEPAMIGNGGLWKHAGSATGCKIISYRHDRKEDKLARGFPYSLPWTDSPPSNQPTTLSAMFLDCEHSSKHLRQQDLEEANLLYWTLPQSSPISGTGLVVVLKTSNRTSTEGKIGTYRCCSLFDDGPASLGVDCMKWRCQKGCKDENKKG